MVDRCPAYAATNTSVRARRDDREPTHPGTPAHMAPLADPAIIPALWPSPAGHFRRTRRRHRPIMRGSNARPGAGEGAIEVSSVRPVMSAISARSTEVMSASASAGSTSARCERSAPLDSRQIRGGRRAHRSTSPHERAAAHRRDRPRVWRHAASSVAAVCQWHCQWIGRELAGIGHYQLARGGTS